MWTNGDFQTNLQKIRNLHTKIEVLNRKGQIVDYIDGKVVSGTINVNNGNMVRRTLDITFIVDNDKLEISPTSPLWINKRLKVYIGIENYSGKIHYYNHGIYNINDPSTDVSVNGRQITVNGEDKMSLFARPFVTDIKFTVDTPVSDAIKGLCTLIGENDVLIETTSYKIPYDLQFQVGSDMQSALKEIVNLYMDYQSYYNVDGYFVFEKIKNRVTDNAIWDFVEDADLTISRTKQSSYSDIKNYVKVIGKMLDDGNLPIYEIKITDNNNPLSMDNIGEKILVVTEDKYTKVEQCRARCEYEIEKAQKMGNIFNLSCVPIYMINDVNKIINIYDKGRIYKCLIDSISMPLGLGTMNISCHELN